MWRPSHSCINNVQTRARLQEDSLCEAVQPDHCWHSFSHSRPVWYLHEVLPGQLLSVPVSAKLRLFTFLCFPPSQVGRAICLPCVVTHVRDWRHPGDWGRRPTGSWNDASLWPRDTLHIVVRYPRPRWFALVNQLSVCIIFRSSSQGNPPLTHLAAEPTSAHWGSQRGYCEEGPEAAAHFVCECSRCAMIRQGNGEKFYLKPLEVESFQNLDSVRNHILSQCYRILLWGWSTDPHSGLGWLTLPFWNGTEYTNDWRTYHGK